MVPRSNSLPLQSLPPYDHLVSGVQKYSFFLYYQIYFPLLLLFFPLSSYLISILS